MHIGKAKLTLIFAQDEVWGLLRENSRLIEQFTNIATSAGPLDNTENIIQQLNLLNITVANGLDTAAPTDL